MKGNREGFLSRSITRRSDQNCKIELQNFILQFCRQLDKKSFWTFCCVIQDTRALHILCGRKRTSAEQKRNAPDAGQTDNGVDDAADSRGLSAKDPCHKVKFENADQTPVDGADDAENQCKSVHELSSLFVLWVVCTKNL